MYKRLRNDVKKSVIMGGFRHTVESPRFHFPEAELWLQSTSARAWQWNLYDWSRWFDIHDVEPQAYYPGIRLQRPDVLAWYYLQGSERPIYMTKKIPDILGSREYPLDALLELYPEGASYLGCQLDYMAMLALANKFERWILYGIGQPYVADRDGVKARQWFDHHGTFLYWLRKAKAEGIDIVYDTPESNLVSDEMLADEEKWPTPAPLKARYGYDMSVDSEYWKRWREDADAEHPFAHRNGGNG